MASPRILTTILFVVAFVIGTLSLASHARAQDYDHERREHERRVDECMDGKRHHIHELEERREISNEEAERIRDHAHEECEREVREHGER